MRALADDAVSEPAHELAIACYAQLGQWGRVTALYERLQAALKEHDLPPPPALRELLRMPHLKRGKSKRA